MAVTQPANGTRVARRSTITIKATASDTSGTHTLRAEATDGAGNVSSSVVTVTSR